MGTRDIYIALVITTVFILFADFLFNESSAYCVLPEHFTDYHVSLLDNNDKVSEDDIKKAKEVLAKADKQKEADNDKNASSATSTNNGATQTDKPKQFSPYASV
jgi:hypothetical protein